MDLSTPLAANIINLCVAIATLAAVLVAFFAIRENRKQSDIAWHRSQKSAEEDRQENRRQIKESWEQTQHLALEERQHQSHPIIVPNGEIPSMIIEGENVYHLYTSEADPQLKGNIIWTLPISSLPIKVSNIGGGPAFNIHCVFYGFDDVYTHQFVSWNNGPIGREKDETILFHHPFQGELALGRDDTVDGIHMLYYALNRPNPNKAQACLTITYYDLFDNKFVSIFDYTPDHRWVRVFVSIPSSPKIDLDLKELNELKKRQAVKLSAPVPNIAP